MSARVVTWAPEFAGAYASLNYEWIERYFRVEDEDVRALENPVDYVLEPGGEIFFLLEGDQPVGTVAMVPHGDGVFELAKMAVRPDRRGRGYSRLLMDACIDFARGRGAVEIMLVTNDVLGPAMGLYQSSGFVAEPYGDDRYARGNTQMRLRL